MYPRMCLWWCTWMEYKPLFRSLSFIWIRGLNITAPANHIVVCSGELVNPTAVYSTAEQTRLAR
jgi:hypothetical protein